MTRPTDNSPVTLQCLNFIYMKPVLPLKYLNQYNYVYFSPCLLLSKNGTAAYKVV